MTEYSKILEQEVLAILDDALESVNYGKDVEDAKNSAKTRIAGRINRVFLKVGVDVSLAYERGKFSFRGVDHSHEVPTLKSTVERMMSFQFNASERRQQMEDAVNFGEQILIVMQEVEQAKSQENSITEAFYLLDFSINHVFETSVTHYKNAQTIALKNLNSAVEQAVNLALIASHVKKLFSRYKHINPEFIGGYLPALLSLKAITDTLSLPFFKGIRHAIYENKPINDEKLNNLAQEFTPRPKLGIFD